MRPVGSQAIVCDQLVLRRVCETSWVSEESVPPVDSQAIMCDQFVLRRVFATKWISVKLSVQFVLKLV